MLMSNPLCENRQMSTLAVPVAARASTTGAPVSAQELFAMENAPIAATFRSSGLLGPEIPAVVGSTTTMSLPAAVGVALVRAITSSLAFGAATTSETALELLPLGLRTCTATLPAADTSPAVTAALHSAALIHVVVRAVPPISNVDPGPGLEGTNPPPSTRNVNPLVPPAYTLAGCSDKMFAPVEIVTFAAPDCAESSWLIA